MLRALYLLTCVWLFRALTKPEQVAHFRETHPIKLKRGTAAVRPSPRLPSDADPLHTYGSLPAFRSMETIRMMGCATASSAIEAHMCNHDMADTYSPVGLLQVRHRGAGRYLSSHLLEIHEMSWAHACDVRSGYL